jgi:SulP family sulfate permease
LIVDIEHVRHLGVSAALALEEAILDMLNAGRQVFLVGAKGQPRKRLESLGLLEKIPEQNIIEQRNVALERAVMDLPSMPQETAA